MNMVLLMVTGGIFHARRGEKQEVAVNIQILVFAGVVAYGRWFLYPL